jgi:hypothetical protein
MDLYRTAIKNGYYIPLIYPIIQILTGDEFLATIIVLKSFPANYWFRFQEHYYFLPEGYNWIKQFVRFTDTGHIISFLYWLSPNYLPMAFTIHFVITNGFWGSKFAFGMEDTDNRNIKDLDPYYVEMWSMANHGLVFCLLTNRIVNHSYECVPFTMNQLGNSYLWLYGWFFGIYVPWRIITRDIVYNILSFNTPIKKTLKFIGFIHILVALGHISGYMLSRC